MLWFGLLPISILFELFAKIMSPVLPVFAQTRWGPGDNNNAWELGPRLPTWLAWFDTPDNSLSGDTGWRTIHCPRYWNSYLGQALWLWRNTACGFSHSVLSRKVWLSDIRFSGDPHIDAASGRYGVFRASDGKGAWQLKIIKKVGGRAFYLNVGWLMDHMVAEGVAVELCPYKISPKVKVAA